MLLFFRTYALIIAILILDQVTKWWVIDYFSRYLDDTIRINSYFELILAWNRGISFGYFGNFNQYSSFVLALINSIIVVYLWIALIRSKSVISSSSYKFMIGGAVGNIMDRFNRGAVCDFLHFHYDDLSFPVFNLADSFIFIGCCLFLYNCSCDKKAIAEKRDKKYDAQN